MAVAPGTPAVTLPAFVAPAFTASSVALGSAVTDVTLVSTSGSSQSNVPFTFGQVFKKGELAPTDFLTGRTTGQPDVPLQFNVKATHPDGSVRHAIISGILPTLSANEARTLPLVRVASSPANTAATASSALTTAGFTATLTLVISGVTYTASPVAALAAGMAGSSVWIGGSIATEWTMMLPLKDGSGNAHPLLTAQFNVRYYPGTTRAKVDVTIENTRAYDATVEVAYDATLTVGGTTAYTYAGVTHYEGTRFYRSVWWGAAPSLHIKHNRAYLVATKQVPNYDLTVTMQESTLAGWAAELSDPKFGPMGSGQYAPYMAGTGGRPDIGLNPAWAAATIISMDKRAKDYTLAGAVCGGSWGTHRRDTSAGPGNGYPLSVVNWPYATWLGNSSDGFNPNTGQGEKFPTIAGKNPNVEDTAHTPNFSYVAYLLTGDMFYLEEIQFYITWVEFFQNCGYRQREKGVLDGASVGQIRGQGWALRSLAEAAAITPDSHYLKPHFKYWLDNTLAAHNTRFTDNPSANKLGVNDTYLPYFTEVGGNRTGIALWQDDHFTSAVGHAAELGFAEAQRLLLWKAKFQVARLIHPDWCYQDAALYCIAVKSVETGPTFDTWAQVRAGTIGTNMDGRGYFDSATVAAPCGSPARLDAMNASRNQPSNPYIMGEITGYSYSTTGYPANLQPALAMAADSGYTDGDLAWMQFDSRTVKPDYGTSPQFAIVPRGASNVPSDPPSGPTGKNIMKLIDLQKQTATVSSTATVTLGSAVAGYRTVAQAIAAGNLTVGDTGVPFYVKNVANGDYEAGYYTITNATTLTRERIATSSNNNAAVAFGGASCEVYCSLPPDYLMGTDIATLPIASTYVDADSVLVVQGGTLKLMAATVAKAYYAAGGTGTPAAATGVTMTGPTTGQVSVQSSNFTVGVTPVGGTISGTVVVTPSDNGGGGSFAPTTVSLTTAGPTGTFKYTPSATAGARTISVTNNGSLTNPANITYTSTAAASTVPGAPTIGTATAGNGYVDVAFTAPASNGGSAILDYTATLSTGETATGTTSPIRVTAANGTARTATVKARNGVGSSAASAASNSVTPAAPAGPAYQLLGPPLSGSTFPANTAMSGSNDAYAGGSPAIYIKTAGNQVPGTDGTVKFVWGKSATTAPMAFNDTAPAAGVNGNNFTHTNAVTTPGPLGGWVNPGDAYFGLYSGPTLYAWGTPGDWYLWVLTADFAKAYDNGTGTAVKWVLS